MSVPILTAPQKPSLGGRILFWVSCIVSLSLLGYLILVVAHQMLVSPPAQRLVDVQDVPLPSGLASNAQQANSLTPGAEVQNGFDLLQIDNFDFQAYDAA